MAIEGKIKSLFSDETKAEAIFPRTKVKAISDDDGVGLDAILNTVTYVDEYEGDVSSVLLNADTLGGVPAGDFATQSFVTDKIFEFLSDTDSGELNIDLSGYVKKEDVIDVVHGGTGAKTASEALANLNGLEIVDATSASYDMDAILKSGTHCKLYKTSSATLGTPYNKGITTFQAALIISFASSASYGKQVAFCSGTKTYERAMNNGEISTWVSSLNTEGGTIYGDLVLGGSNESVTTDQHDLYIRRLVNNLVKSGRLVWADDGTLKLNAASAGTVFNSMTLGETETTFGKPVAISSGGTGADLSSVAQGSVIAMGSNGKLSYWNKVPLAQGGTGADLSEVPPYAVVRKISSGNYLGYTATGDGAMYATKENGQPIFGTLPVEQGGTGATTAAGARTSLGAAATSHEHKAGDITSGTLPLARGGIGINLTGQSIPNWAIIRASSDVAGDKPYLYFEPTKPGAFFATEENKQASFGTLPVEYGGTGATTASAARTSLNAASLGSNTFTGSQTIPNGSCFKSFIKDADGGQTTQTNLIWLSTNNKVVLGDSGDKLPVHVYGELQPSVALSPTYGGTGRDFSSAPNNAIIRKNGDGENKLYYTATNNGAFYATAENGSPKFGTLPIAQGGTGATSAADARANLDAASLGANTFTGSQTIPAGEKFRTKDASGTTVNLMWVSADTDNMVIGSSENKKTIIMYGSPDIRGSLVLASGTSNCYGSSLPTAGTKGRIFFKKVSS